MSSIIPERACETVTAKKCRLVFGHSMRGRPAGIVGFVFASMLLISCTNSDVRFVKEPLTVEKKFFDPVKDKGKIPVEESEEALTVWRFGCKTDFGFDVVEKIPLGEHDYMVTIKITSVKMTLAAPVTVYLPNNAPPPTVQHEDAHVEICKRVYGGIDAESKKAARSVLGAKYQDSGETVEAACRRCVERAGADVYERYQSMTSLPVNRVSEIFDELAGQSKEDPKVLLEKAFSRYQQISSVTPQPK